MLPHSFGATTSSDVLTRLVVAVRRRSFAAAAPVRNVELITVAQVGRSADVAVPSGS